MQNIKAYIFPMSFLAAAIIMAVYAMDIRSQALVTHATYLQKQMAEAQQEKAKPISSKEMLDIKNLIEALAIKNKLLLRYNIVNDTHTITVAALATNKDQGLELLAEHFTDILALWTDIAGLPWNCKFRNLCLGADCTNTLNFEVTVK